MMCYYALEEPNTFKKTGICNHMTEKDFFPHEIIREGQDEMLKDFEDVLKEEKILLAHAPTGIGKTATALSMAVKYALEKEKKVFFLTNRHTQHQIAINTLRLIKEKINENLIVVDLIGKRWMCNQEIAGLFGVDFSEFCKSITEKGECEFYNNVSQKKNLTVEAKRLLKELEDKSPLHNEEVIRLCKTEKLCSYEISMALAKKAKVIIGDYNYVFNPFVQSSIFKKLEISLEDVILIVDEGHNLPNRIVDMLSCNLTSFMLKNSIMEAKKFGFGGVISWLQKINTVLNNLANFEDKSKEKLISKEQFSKKVNEIVDYKELITELELAADEIRKKQRKSYLGGVANFLLQWEGEDKGYARIIAEKETKYGDIITLNYSCLDPSFISKDIFSQVHSGLIMSGTLNPTFMFKDLLAIEKGIEKEYKSPFPPENKLNIVIPETTTKFTLRNESMYKNIAEKCSEIITLTPGNIALFFPSYYMRDLISNFIKSPKKFFWEKSEMSKEEKEMLLDDFKREKEIGGVLLGVTGANFAEGIDFPGDLLNGVIVVGLPLGKPNLKTTELIKYYDTKFKKGWDYGYTYPAMSKCIQSAGRCIRSETDKGVVIYLDERFAWQRYYDCFPERVGLIVTKDYKNKIKEFFEK
ncbi:MAG: ATP-dependent DNA helicase [Candidatus Woesearchaeota archaeon]